ncbi:CAF17-like 4Fe-4S cluster assembly/insertion protein YgfZ [Leifsonella bigeumensis]|uniref:CAF17-like 4Fe-4S cluster assembly/insertion protein YgfZ n=1 Tax=Leifsonella bigeumensis TaxID=433643 RepID=UPI003CD0A2E5
MPLRGSPVSTEPVSVAGGSVFLTRDGAVAGSGGPDAGVAAHYGNPIAEQRTLAAGKAIVDLSHRGILSVTGADRLGWLDSVTSQALAKLAPGESAEALLLDPTGRIEHVLRVVDDGTTAWLLVEAGEAAGLLAWLESMRFMMRVEVADRAGEFAVVGWFADAADAMGDATGGGLALPVAAPNGIPLTWVDPWGSVTAGGHQYADDGTHPYGDWSWRESLVERAALAGLSGLPAAGTMALEALRIAAWRPRFATEVDERSIPHELDWLRSAVHLAKGCYRGQETVAKVHNLGHPPRRLVMLHLDGSDAVLPPAGAEVALDGRVVGRITSSAIHHEFGPIALAVVKRNTDPQATLTVEAEGVTVAAAQEVIVPVDAGATANVPRMPRLGAR